MATAAVQQFRILQSRGSDRRLRITLLGELDIAVADQLEQQILRLVQTPQRIVLDLSQLSFIDACGLAAIRRASESAGGSLGKLEVDTNVSRCVQRLLALVDAAEQTWVASGDARRGYVTYSDVFFSSPPPAQSCTVPAPSRSTRQMRRKRTRSHSGRRPLPGVGEAGARQQWGLR